MRREKKQKVSVRDMGVGEGVMGESGGGDMGKDSWVTVVVVIAGEGFQEERESQENRGCGSRGDCSSTVHCLL